MKNVPLLPNDLNDILIQKTTIFLLYKDNINLGLLLIVDDANPKERRNLLL
jgi:hypothetical protein